VVLDSKFQLAQILSIGEVFIGLCGFGQQFCAGLLFRRHIFHPICQGSPYNDLHEPNRTDGSNSFTKHSMLLNNDHIGHGREAFCCKYFKHCVQESPAWFLLPNIRLHDDLSASEYKHILRIAGKDVEGGKKLLVALSEVKGVGYNFAQVLTQSLGIDANVRVGFLTDDQVKEIEKVLVDPAKVSMPEWYLNRKKDMDSGTTHHLITSDLDFSISNDIDREKTVMSWRGYRHMFGLRVRGQCTRTTGRRGGAVGVKKTKMMPGAAPAAAGAAAKPTASAAPAAAGAAPAKPAAKEPEKK
jgi:small subunit ribosomal protein S13